MSKVGRCQRRAVPFRTLVDLLINDPHYQRKLRKDFAARRVHPTVENAIWTYHAGKPREGLDVTLDLGERFAAERDLLLGLSLEQLEALAAESQAVVDRAIAMARSAKPQRPDIAVDALPDKVSADSLAKPQEPVNEMHIIRPNAPDMPAYNPDEQFARPRARGTN